MDAIFEDYLPCIKSLLNDDDVYKFLREPLMGHFEMCTRQYVVKNLDHFFEEFKKIKDDKKYDDFVEVTKDISEWIPLFLGASAESQEYRKQFTLIFDMIHLQSEEAVKSFPMNDIFLFDCYNEGLITLQVRDELQATLNNKGRTTALYKFLWEIHRKSKDCYGLLLKLLYRKKSNYIEKFCDDLNKRLAGVTEREAEDYIKAYAESIIDKNMNVSIKEEKIKKGDEIEFYDRPGIECGPPMEGYTGISDNDVNVIDKDTKVSLKEDDTNKCDNTEFDGCPEGVVSESSFSDQKCFPDESDKDSTEGDDIVDPDFDNIFGEYKNKTSIDLLNFQPEPKSYGGASLEMRQYQNELAKTGVEGRNVLICAPTSSGKTVVAIKIIDEHLKLKPGRKAALVVPTTVLVDQQYNLFQKYLGKNWKINKLSGGSKSFSAPLSKQIKDYDIFVFTCDILRNSLEGMDESLGSIGEFTLIIFDECHHCDKDHSYNKVMDHYFKDKVMDIVIPQIIGMTASTGTDKAKSVENALKSLFSLCANLDCHTVSSVKTNIEELNRNVPMPSSEVKSPGERSQDLFECSLIALMEFTEDIVMNIFSKKKSLSVPVDKYHDKYLTFVKSITNHVPNMLEEEERKAVKITEIYLEGFFRSLIVNHLFNSNHAINMLKEKISLQTPFTCDVEKILRQKFKEFLLSTSLDQDSNPCLDCLKEEIVKQIKVDKKSKIIVFVKEVLYTKILENEIQAAELGFIQCKALVGTNKGLEQGGISKSVTEDIVNNFRQGIINLIFATSVAEEGLDIEKCNLVVRYGHVTNEISMVQSRGRARASQSKYIVIVPQKLRWQINKENVNKARESMMYRAIEMFQDMELKDLKVELVKFQKKRLALRFDVANNNEIFTVPNVCDASDWSLHCNKCEKYICSSEDIRVVNGTSYVIINKEAYPRVKKQKPKLNNCPLVCSGCENNLGYVIKVGGINVPTINIRQTILKRGDENKKYKQWKDAPFNIPQASGHDISNCHSEMFDY